MSQERDEMELEFAAQIAALRFLLEQAYAHALFAGNAAGFSQFMTHVISLSREKGTVLQATSDEEALEVKARTAVHLDRFRNSVIARISSND